MSLSSIMSFIALLKLRWRVVAQCFSCAVIRSFLVKNTGEVGNVLREKRMGWKLMAGEESDSSQYLQHSNADYIQRIRLSDS
jgi:hypothetical protein